MAMLALTTKSASMKSEKGGEIGRANPANNKAPDRPHTSIKMRSLSHLCSPSWVAHWALAIQQTASIPPTTSIAVPQIVFQVI